MVFPIFRSSICLAYNVSILVFFLASLSFAQEQLAPYQKCHDDVLRIMNGSLSIGTINNITIWEPKILYAGQVPGLDPSYPRDKFITLTKAGQLNLNVHPDWELRALTPHYFFRL